MIRSIALLLLLVGPLAYAQNKSDKYSLEELRMRFKHPGYTEKILSEFQKTLPPATANPKLHEDLPGEVISWYTMVGQYSYHKTYLIDENTLKEVSTIPMTDSFLNKLNSYVPPQSKFSYSSDLWSFAFVTKKSADNYYWIKATAKSFNSHPEIPNDDILLYEMEYKTLDFISFYLVRLKDIHVANWIEVDPK